MKNSEKKAQALYALSAVLAVCGLMLGGADGDNMAWYEHLPVNIVGLALFGLAILAGRAAVKREAREITGIVRQSKCQANDGCGKYYGPGIIPDFRITVHHKGMMEDEDHTPGPSPMRRGDEGANSKVQVRRPEPTINSAAVSQTITTTAE